MNTNNNPFLRAIAVENSSILTFGNIVESFFNWRAEQMAIFALESPPPPPSAMPESIVHDTMYHSRESCGRSFLGGLWKLGGPMPKPKREPVVRSGAEDQDHTARSRFAKVYLNVGRDIRNNYAPLFARLRQNDTSALFRLLEMIYMHYTIKTYARYDTAIQAEVRKEYRTMVRRMARTGPSADRSVVGSLARDPFRNHVFVAVMTIFKEEYVRTMAWAIDEGEVPGWRKVEDHPASLLAAYTLWGKCYHFESLKGVFY